MEKWENLFLDAVASASASDTSGAGWSFASVTRTDPLTVSVNGLDYSGTRLFVPEHLRTRTRRAYVDNIASDYESHNKRITTYEEFQTGDLLAVLPTSDKQRLLILARLSEG